VHRSLDTAAHRADRTREHRLAQCARADFCYFVQNLCTLALCVRALREERGARSCAPLFDSVEARLRGFADARIDLDAARAAIVGPVARYNRLAGENVRVEDELVDAILDQTAVGRVDLGAGGAGLVAGRDDGVVTVRDRVSGRVRATIRVPKPLAVVDATPSEALLAAGGRVVRVRRATGATFAFRNPARVKFASFVRAAPLVVTTAVDVGVRVWRTTGALIRTLRGPAPANFAVVARSANRVVTIAEDAAGHVQPRLYDLRTGRLLRVLPQRGTDRRRSGGSATGSRIAASSTPSPPTNRARSSTQRSAWTARCLRLVKPREERVSRSSIAPELPGSTTRGLDRDTRTGMAREKHCTRGLARSVARTPPPIAFHLQPRGSACGS
jgi:hypothetical protein